MKQWLLVLLVALVSQTLWAQDASEDAPVEEASAAPAATAQAPAPQAPSLEQAYQKEFAFLQGQKQELERRLAQFNERAGRERDRLTGEIAGLERQVVEMSGRADRLDDRVFESEREVDAARENTDLLSATFLQADVALDEWEADATVDTPGAEDVAALFAAAHRALASAGAVTRGPGEFFLADGKRVSGEVIRIGNIAAYGLSEQGAGALAPAGEGELRVWDDTSGAAARELAAGSMPASLPVFIFESLNNEVERGAAKTVFQTIQSGGVIGWIIFFLGLLALALIVLRAVFLSRAGTSTSGVLDAISGHVERGDRKAALNVLKRRRGATARVMAAAIRNLDRDREHLEDIVSEAILHENGHLNRFGAFITVIAAVAPLLGLLGTVTGMISTFDVITEFGTGDPKLLSGGISIALVTTEMGLIVAIPALLLGNLLSSWAERIKDDMEKAALNVINRYTEARATVNWESA